MSLYLPLFKALDDAGVRYVVVGGLATVLHGYARLTTDIDLIVDLVPKEAARTIRTLESLGFQPRLPVVAAEFADAGKRREWIEQKGMEVFSFHNPAEPMLSVDLFVEHPIPFDDLRARALRLVIDGVAVYICSIDDLIELNSGQAVRRTCRTSSDCSESRAWQTIIPINRPSACRRSPGMKSKTLSLTIPCVPRRVSVWPGSKRR